jgi:lambda repressor-like predicted transcriptional regulator
MPLSPNDRKAELVRRGVSMSEIARRLEVTPQHVSQVISGDRRSTPVEAAVAAAIGMAVAEVFEPATAAA